MKSSAFETKLLHSLNSHVDHSNLILGSTHSYCKELVRKPGKLQRNKQRTKDLCWKVHDPAQSFVLCSHTLAELRNRRVSIG